MASVNTSWRIGLACATFWLVGASMAISSEALALAADEAAAPRKPNWAATRLDEVDEDYPFQGEFWGWTTIPGGPRQFMALQVVALGSGKFDGVLLTGGLPGWGWNRRDRAKLSGERADDRVTLVGLGTTAVVTPNAAALVGSDNVSLGVLTRTVRHSPTENQRCPAHGHELFTAGTTSGFKNPRITAAGLLDVGAETAEPIDNFYLHLEFQLPYMPLARGQGRANSGVYIQSRYEVQILDSFGLEGKNNECAALYTYKAPDQNLCFPPLAWQTYDIEYRSPKFDDDGKKTANGELTVWHNGEKVHDRFAFERKTGAGQPEGPKPLATKLQDHGNPVRFRNIWYVSLPASSESAPPPQPAGATIAASPAPCGSPVVIPGGVWMSHPAPVAGPVYGPLVIGPPWGGNPPAYQPEPLPYQFRSAFAPFGGPVVTPW